MTWIKAPIKAPPKIVDMDELDTDALAECELAMIREHGKAAADVAQKLAETLSSLGVTETAEFWELLARNLRDSRSTIH